MLRKRLRVPVLVDNDVNTLAVWERLYGRGREFEHFVTVTIGRGVGLGVVVSGDIYRGMRGGAGEFGHVTVVDGGPKCTCGKTGCLEAVVGDPALVAQARRAGILSSRQGIDALRRLAEQGDQAPSSIYARAGAVLGRAVSGLVNVLAPELVLISGEGTQAWSLLEPSFERELRAHIFTSLGRRTGRGRSLGRRQVGCRCRKPGAQGDPDRIYRRRERRVDSGRASAPARRLRRWSPELEGPVRAPAPRRCPITSSVRRLRYE